MKKPIATLILFAMVLPELVTGSTPLYGFLNPVNLVILFFGYGITVLLIREYAVQYNLNFFGLFLLALAYVCVNEGFLAKTILLKTGVPVSTFDNYGYILGLSIPWALAMGLWHAMYSVIFPIVATHFFFPEAAKTPFLGKKTSFFLIVPVIFLSLAIFFSTFRGTGNGVQLFLMVLYMAILWIAARKFGKKHYETPAIFHQVNGKAVWLGISSILFVTVLLTIVVSGFKLPILIFFAVYILGIWFYIRQLNNRIGIENDTLLLFILGGYIETAICGILIGLFLAPVTFGERLISEVGILIFAFILIKKVIKRHASNLPASSL